MPPIRSKKYQERLKLALRIEAIGIKLSPSCSSCSKYNRECIASEESTRCSECARRGVRCDTDGMPSISDWDVIEREEARLKKLEDEAMTAISQLPRIHKQKECLRTRATDMLRRGLKSLDELDAVEEGQKLAAELAMNELENVIAGPQMAPNVADGGLFLGLEPDKNLWASLGFDGSTQAPQSI